MSIYAKSFLELLFSIKNVLHFENIKLFENKMVIISGIFSFAIWEKIPKIAKFNTREIKYVYASLIEFVDFAQKI